MRLPTAKGNLNSNGKLHMTTKITGVVTTQNCSSVGQPIIEAIRSLAKFCVDVVVLDCGSTDSTLADLQQKFGDNPQIKIKNSQIRFWPGIKTDQVASILQEEASQYGDGEYVFRIEADEVVEEGITKKVEILPTLLDNYKAERIMLPIAEFMGSFSRVRADRMTWDIRFSKMGARDSEPIVPIGVEIESLRHMNHATKETWFTDRMSVLPTILKVNSLFSEQVLGVNKFLPATSTFRYSGEIPAELMAWAKGVSYF